MLLPTQLQSYGACASYFLHCILVGQATRGADANGFVRLKSEYLRRVIPDRIEKALRQSLIVAGVVEWDKSYIEGEKSMGYRISDSMKMPSMRVRCDDERSRRAQSSNYESDWHPPTCRSIGISRTGYRN